ncbi:cell wall-binding repeat-containing protein [Desulfosporosinus sp.]|uniref:cell wall-binding repeat-containing protein n=1 Tax=Desulfosporosinus sp. TaxID=157907 RepID=UPI0025C1588A|nr:cell wall-binding repeat-containing protein [Desulfosporosinus sp.]MBC2725364.1 cell wall-binding repeat-containing protein [Desulfosporosinus sp.]
MKKRFVLIFVFAFMYSFTSIAYASTAKRLAGETKYDTSALIVQDGWQQSDYALLAFGENYPDALSAVPLAKKYDAPILLTSGNSLPTVTKETLIRLQVKNVFIIGGTAVIPSSIDTELQGMKISVTRVAGRDRYDTAIKIAEQFPSPTEIMIVTGEDYPDALSIGPIAALKQTPIILVPKDYLPASVQAYLSTNKINKSYVVGDSTIISDNLVDQFPGSERIVVGVDKYERNINVNTEFDHLFSSKDFCLTTGEGYADALTGAAYAAKKELPIVLVNDNPPLITRQFTVDKLNQYNDGVPYVFGGSVVVPDSVVEYLLTLPDTDQTNKPSAPTNLVATPISSSQITIQWDQISDADYYHIYYTLDDPNSFLYSFINSDGSKLQCKWFPQSSAQLNDIEANTTVYFKVTSVKDGVESNYSNVASALTFP